MHTSPIKVQKALKDMDYSTKKQDFLEYAKKHKASSEVTEVLEDLPDREYTNAADVKEFKGK